MSPFRHPRLLRALLVLGAMAFLGLTLLTIYLAAGETRQLTPRGDFVLKTPGKKLYAKASDNTATVEILPIWWSVPAKAN